jgi:hypothetical protein
MRYFLRNTSGQWIEIGFARYQFILANEILYSAPPPYDYPLAIAAVAVG